MKRGQRKKEQKCQRHGFQLKPKFISCYFSQNITGCFCKNSDGHTLAKYLQNSDNKCIDCPVYNNDRNYGSPSFILHSEKKYYAENGLQLKVQHQRKVIDYTDQKIELWVPKPKSKLSYCSSCRENYEDYLNHIKSQRHSKKINSCIFNKHIIELTEYFPKVKEQPIEEIKISTSPHENTQLQTLGRPRKIQKLENQPNYNNIPNFNNSFLQNLQNYQNYQNYQSYQNYQNYQNQIRYYQYLRSSLLYYEMYQHNQYPTIIQQPIPSLLLPLGNVLPMIKYKPHPQVNVQPNYIIIDD